MSTEAIPSSKIILGCAPSGGLYHKEISTQTVVDMIHRSIVHHQVTTMDTAPWYGCGKSEQDIGAAMKALPNGVNAKDVHVITKVGRVTFDRSELKDSTDERVKAALAHDTCYAITDQTGGQVCLHDCTYDGVMKSFGQSTARLGGETTTITTLRMHDADTDALYNQCLNEGGIKALQELKAAGECTGISLGMNDPEKILDFLKHYQKDDTNVFDNVMMAGCWNLIDQSGAEVLAFAQDHNVDVHVAGVFGAGLLWGANNYRYGKASEDVLARRDQWKAICEKHNIALPAFAIKFALLPAAASHVALGCASADELDGCMAMAAAVPNDAVTIAILSEAVAAGLIEDSILSRLVPIWKQ